jgi:hypothetical protein
MQSDNGGCLRFLLAGFFIFGGIYGFATGQPEYGFICLLIGIVILFLIFWLGGPGPGKN